MYPNLKLQLWRSGIRQNRLAQLIGIHETLLSKIVNGFRQPDAKVKARIAAVQQLPPGHGGGDMALASGANIYP